MKNEQKRVEAKKHKIKLAVLVYNQTNKQTKKNKEQTKKSEEQTKKTNKKQI